MIRKGMTKGSGRKGYYNIIGIDPKVHSMSAKGMKQPQKVRVASFLKSEYPKLSDEKINKIFEDYLKEEKKPIFIKEPFGLPYELTDKDQFRRSLKDIVKNKSNIKSIKIYRAEGNSTEDSNLGKWQTYNNVNDANNRLRQISSTAPKTGGYDKTDVIVTFDNGFVYKGRWDVKHYSQQHADLDIQKHIKDTFDFKAGNTERGKEWIEKGYTTKEGQKEAQKYLEELNLGGKCKPSDLKKGNISDLKFNNQQLKIGTKVETEHTNNKQLAKAISKAHLSENKNYYKKLKEAKL
jgi:hypothetical protein